MIIKNGTVITPFETLSETDVSLSGDIISGIGTEGEGGEVIDARGLYVCPGFVDIHTHGGGGGDFMDACDDAFEKAIGFHAKHGTTSVLATSVTAPEEAICEMLGIVRRYINSESDGARILGAHIEGPYISFKEKGAQSEKFLKVPARDGYGFILDNKDIIKTVTVATELDGMIDMIRELCAEGIAVSCGHDDGRVDTIKPAIDAGLSHCTHWSCAMSTVSMKDGVRSVGMREMALLDPRLTLELIADNHHTTPELVQLAYKCKGARGMCIVSDSLRAGGMKEDGTLYSLGGVQDERSQKFIVADGVAKLPDCSRFAGSIQPLGQMVKNLVKDSEIPLSDAVAMASYTPASIIGAQDTIGSIEVGKKADFCLMDKDCNVVKTIIGGKIYKG